MADDAHDLEFTVLEPLVLKNPLNGSILSRWRQLGLKDDTERAISYDLTLRILQVPSLASNSILNLLTDNLSHPEAVKGVWPMSRHGLNA
jgi:hypothetical protein